MSLNTVPALVLYDRSCPVCETEMYALKAIDQRGSFELEDISGLPAGASHSGFSREAMMANLHVRTADGRWLIGVFAVRHVYELVGRGAWWWPTYLPGAGWLAQRAYGWLARNRYRVSHWVPKWHRSGKPDCSGNCRI
ncbi:MAG: DUF393 domain-containing protein [Ahniella sp.]|nr:DUF393 domain-containing protein [Ahniella sp.]